MMFCSNVYHATHPSPTSRLCQNLLIIIKHADKFVQKIRPYGDQWDKQSCNFFRFGSTLEDDILLKFPQEMGFPWEFQGKGVILLLIK